MPNESIDSQYWQRKKTSGDFKIKIYKQELKKVVTFQFLCFVATDLMVAFPFLLLVMHYSLPIQLNKPKQDKKLTE